MKAVYRVLASLGICMVPSLAMAEYGGITISPPLKQVVINPTSPQEVSFKVTNGSSTNQTYELGTADFKSLYESGGVAFIGQEVGEYKYGLAKWITLEDKEITFRPGETREIKVVISNDISPGGHYSAILLTSRRENILDKNSRVDLRQVASTLLFAIKSGGAKYDLRFDKFVNLSRWMFAPPQKIRLRFYNAGNVHVIPRGIIRITDPLGKQVGQGAVNTETGFVLPESFRQYVVNVNSLGHSWLPGIYKISVAYRYEGTDKEHIATQSVAVANWYSILALVTILSVLITALWQFWSRKH